MQGMLLKNEEIVSFTMTGNQKTFMMPDESIQVGFPLNYSDTDSQLCTVHARIFGLSLLGYEITLIEQNFRGDHFDLSASDQTRRCRSKTNI